MSVEGQIKVVFNPLSMDRHIEIQSSRPTEITQIFRGKTAEEVLTMVPRIYGICSTAQCVASVNAFRSALNIDIPTTTNSAEQLLVAVETIREHYWRISIDWPRYLLSPVAPAPSPRASTWLQHVKTALFGDISPANLSTEIQSNLTAFDDIKSEINTILKKEVFGIDIKEWLKISSHGDLETWATEQTTVAAQIIKQHLHFKSECFSLYPLPKLENHWLKEELLSDNGVTFAAQPQINGHCAETTPLTRQVDHPLIQDVIKRNGTCLLSRLTARLLELATLANQLNQFVLPQIDKDKIQWDSTGISQIEAARGRLIHCVALKNDRVNDYRIVAPTEWNFHPDGILKHLLESTSHISEQFVRLLINSIDPCVAYELVME
jgi:Ni,Fe-hydrogenase I large subunit